LATSSLKRLATESRPSTRVPPHNLEAEESVLGACLISREAIANVVEAVSAEDFYKPAHGVIFEAILSLYGRGEPVDAVTLAEELRRGDSLEQIGGATYIHTLVSGVPTAGSATYYARIVEELALLRRLIDASQNISDLAFNVPEDVAEAVDQAESLIYQVSRRRISEDFRELKGLLTENMEMVEKLYERGSLITGLASGFTELDNITAGFQPSNLIIVAARPSMGKSALAVTVAQHVAINEKKPVVVFSLEMSKMELVQRLLCAEARVDSSRLRRGSLQDSDWPKLSHALGRLAEAPIFIDDTAQISVMEMRAKCRRLQSKHGLGLVIIDYLQLMQPVKRTDNRVQEVSEISRSLKILARELDVPVIAVSQLSRNVEYRSDKRPLLADLRDSGCLTGESLVTLASGRLAKISDLVGQTPEVVSLDGWNLSTAKTSRVWHTGRKPAFRLTTATGRVIRATANHPFRQLGGWHRLDRLQIGDLIAISGPESARMEENRGLARFSSTLEPIGSSVLLQEADLKAPASSDIYWDTVRSIEPDGVEDVYDITVPGTHNFVANGVVVHNSIEQDSDLVMFIYRDEVYNPDSPQKGIAEIHVAKHRNGPIGKVELTFLGHYTKFADLARMGSQ
jgi:replicative DNA helicase